MHICHVYHRFYPVSTGGIESQIFLESNFLSGHDFHLRFSLITDCASFLPFLHGIRKHQDYGNLKVYRLGANIVRVLIDSFTAFHLSSKALQKIALRRLFLEAASLPALRECDVFHLHGCWENPYEELALMMSKHFDKPLVVSLHGTYLPGPEVMPIPGKLTRNLLRHAKAIITYSTNVLDKLDKWKLSAKSHLIPNLVDTRYFVRPCNSYKRSGKKVIFVGRLSDFKDPITPTIAFKYLREKVPTAKLLIVGYGPLYDRLKSLVRDLELEGTILLMGSRGRNEIRKLFWDSDIFLATSPVTNYLSLSLLEALASGLSVIATDTGETRSIIRHGENGILVPPGDPKELAKALGRVMTEENLRQNLLKEGLRTAQKYDVHVIAPKIASIYKSL